MGVWNDISYEDQLTYLKMALAGSITCIKDNIATGNLSAAKEAWQELEDYQQSLLWTAQSRGGPFTHKEKSIMKSKDWREAK